MSPNKTKEFFFIARSSVRLIDWLIDCSIDWLIDWSIDLIDWLILFGRYCSDFLTTGRKLQFETQWWAETLKSFQGRNVKRNQEEEAAIRDELLHRPRPTKLNDYKGHPLYVLRPHLTKYEALYPPNPIPVDHVGDEPVFLRECVALLHVRETWLRAAKSVRPGEVPYKEVKKIKRKKKGRKNLRDPNAALMASIAEKEAQKEEMVGLFGEWQVEDFVPPVAKDVSTVLSHGVRSLFGPTRKSSLWGNFSDGGSFVVGPYGWLIDWLTIS